jgi:iron complex outermembrane receptor protein
MGLLEYASAKNPNYIGTADRVQGSVLLGVNGRPFNKWEFGAYIQPTWNDQDFEFLPMGSVAFKPFGHDQFTLGINASKNVHFPNLNDLYWVPGGNPNLAPEKSVNGEFNIHKEGEAFHFMNYEMEAAVFYGEVDNWILWQPTDKSYWEAQNIKAVTHSGMDVSLSLSKKINSWTYKFQSGYQFVSAINKDVEDESLNKQLIYTPKHLGNALARIDYNKGWLQANYTYTGKRYITTSNTSYLPAYDLINVSGGAEIKMKGTKGILFQLDVNNVLGKEYMSVAYRAMPGINFQLYVKYVFN